MQDLKNVKPKNKSRVTCFVQARYLSTRLVGKVLKKIGQHTALELCIRRLMLCRKIDEIVVLTGDIKANERIVEECKKHSFDIFRGSEEDVLKRFVDASENYLSDILIRITADCPLIDPNQLDSAIEIFQRGTYDYLSNTLPPSFPDGLDFEIFTRTALKEADKLAIDKFDREHVTPILRRDNNFSRFNVVGSKDYSNIRWTLDAQDDLNLIQSMVEGIPNPITATFEDYLKAFTEMKLENHKSQLELRNEGAMLSKSKKLYSRAKKIIPGGTSLLSKRPEMFDPQNWPAYFSECHGISVNSIDGQTYSDFSTMSVGSCTLGYGNLKVDDAVISAVRNGVSCSLNAPEEVYVAERLLDLHDWAHGVRFARTGGEANAIAIRIARAATGKNKVAVCGYHGWHDWYLAANLGEKEALDDLLLPGLSTRGINSGLRGSTITFAYGDKQAFEKSLDNDTACVIMEVCRSSKPNIEFIQHVRKVCSERSIVLIFDECSSGFRENLGGMHLKLGVYPDLCMVGKAIGNGYALTAVFGVENIMEVAQETFISSTFWTERIGPAAALATLSEMESLKSYIALPEIGVAVKEQWSTAAGGTIDINIAGFDAIPNFSFSCNSSLAAKTLFSRLMLEEGFLATTAFYASIEHTDKDIKKYGEACQRAFRKIGELNDCGDLERFNPSEVCHSGFRRLN